MPLALDKCPECERGNLRQVADSDWWECDHCLLIGPGNALRLHVMSKGFAGNPPVSTKP